MLYLIGRYALDLDASERIGAWLAKLQPSTVGVESNEEDFYGGIEAYFHLQDKSKLEGAARHLIRSYPDANFDTAKKFMENNFKGNGLIGMYCMTLGIEPCFGEHPAEKLDEEGEQVMLSNQFNHERLARFLKLDPAQAYIEAETHYAKQSFPVPDDQDYYTYCQIRDSHAEKVIRQMGANAIYFCGTEPIFGQYSPNLYDRLRDLYPIRSKLNEIEKKN